MNPYVLPAALGVGVLLLAQGAGATAPLSIPYDEELGYEGPLDYDQNLDAYLAVLRLAESSNNYKALVGGGNFTSYADHPTPGEGFEGIVTPFGPSHAAGAYQFQPGTWREARAALGLPDFSPASQDQAAVFLIKRRGAYAAVRAGDTGLAQSLLRNEWAGLEARGLSWVNDVFTANGGYLS
jgi:lysozyme